MHTHGGTVMRRTCHRDLEFAGKEREFGMQRRPLSQQFTNGARVCDFICGGTGPMVRGHVADAVAGGLNAVHFNFGQGIKNVSRVFQLDPVVLNVLSRGEVAIAAVPLVGDVGQAAHLL